MRRAGTSVAARVSFAGLASAAIAAAIAAIVACSFAEILLVRATDRSLEAAATELARDLERELPAGRSIEEIVREEEDEGTSLGLGFAIVGASGEPLGGDRHLAASGAGCTSTGELRACTVVGAGGVRVTAGTRSASRLPLFAVAALAAAALAALVAWALGGALARRALAPLVRLEGRIAGLRLDAAPEATRRAELGAPEGVREVDELREAVVVLHARMLDALAHSSRFATNAAHELRTPLATLRAELELLAEAKGDAAAPPSSRPDAIARALAKARQLQDLTEKLLVLALPEVREEGRGLVSLREIVEEIVLDLPPAEADRITVAAGEDVLVRGDAAALSIVISNGISNALKFGDAVVVSVARDGGEALLAIEDDGPGVPAEERGRVFEPFERGTQRTSAPGHGIGLTLVAHVAKRHSGSARLVTSQRFASGTRLEVRLPPAE